MANSVPPASGFVVVTHSYPQQGAQSATSHQSGVVPPASSMLGKFLKGQPAALGVSLTTLIMLSGVKPVLCNQLSWSRERFWDIRCFFLFSTDSSNYGWPGGVLVRYRDCILCTNNIPYLRYHVLGSHHCEIYFFLNPCAKWMCLYNGICVCGCYCIFLLMYSLKHILLYLFSVLQP